MKRNNKQDQDPDGPPSYEDTLTYSVFLSGVLGKTLDEIIGIAKVEAAKALGTRPENIYIIGNSALVAAAVARFGEETLLWRAAVTCGVVPPSLRI